MDQLNQVQWLNGLNFAYKKQEFKFQAHSFMAAATSVRAAMSGLTVEDILQAAADWSSESVFQKFYY